MVLRTIELRGIFGALALLLRCALSILYCILDAGNLYSGLSIKSAGNHIGSQDGSGLQLLGRRSAFVPSALSQRFT